MAWDLNKISQDQKITTMATTVTPSELSIKNLFLLIAGCIIICACASWIGSVFTTEDSGGWYSTIHKPSFNPPSDVIASVWFMLYMAMAVSLFYVLRAHHPNKNLAVGLFLAQLALNVLWSLIFFKMHHIGLAFVEMLVLIGLLVSYYIVAKPIRPIAAYLFIPYIAWVVFAAFVTANIWSMN
ncbi:MAG TPA: TspO/MBR family protein [Cytophagaceae bacterium]|jgi:benzodiazapine receptor|nr:TspO/MBR family protein [Cytophagaceae bacterium]